MAPVAQQLRKKKAAELTKTRVAAALLLDKKGADATREPGSGLCPGASKADPSGAAAGGGDENEEAAQVDVSPDDEEARPSWEEVCAAAAKSSAECHLQASSGFFGKDESGPGAEKLKYHNWGAAVSEVEVRASTALSRSGLICSTRLLLSC